MEQLTTYRTKGKELGLVFLFKYDLNGNLREFKIEEGDLNGQQMKWLFSVNFPAHESMMRSVWMVEPKYKKVFEVEKFNADLSFEAFWTIWNLKVKKEHSEKAWNKLKEADKIKCFLIHKKYQEHLNRTGQAKAHLVTWLNQKRYNDEY
ncbi:MAG: hypothetical protein AB7D46_00725 [Flavobacteriaceae bacterium]